jgi:hypothetical protein
MANKKSPLGSNIYNYSNYSINTQKRYYLKSYLAGLFEGDGHI